MHPTPHDTFFKRIFSQREHARSFFEHHLSAPIAAAIDWNTLSLAPGSFVDQALRERHSDLLFSASLRGHTIFFYILFEHQSTVDPFMPLRLLISMTRIWERYHIDQPNEKRIPFIYPLVLHHSETGWTATTSFEDMFELDEEIFALLAEHVPRFRFALEDISHVSDDELMRSSMTALVRLGLWCLKNSRSEDLLVQIRRWLGVLREVVNAPNGMAALAAILHYMSETNERLGVDDLRGVVAQLGSKKFEEQIMTLADRLRQEGREKGIDEGRVTTLRANLRRVLIRRKLFISPEDLARIEQCNDVDVLERWFEQAFDAASTADALR